MTRRRLAWKSSFSGLPVMHLFTWFIRFVFVVFLYYYCTQQIFILTLQQACFWISDFPEPTYYTVPFCEEGCILSMNYFPQLPHWPPPLLSGALQHTALPGLLFYRGTIIGYELWRRFIRLLRGCCLLYGFVRPSNTALSPFIESPSLYLIWLVWNTTCSKKNNFFPIGKLY